MAKSQGKTKKPKTLIEKLRALITEDPDSKNPTGTGGARRARNIDDAVTAMETGISEADTKTKRKRK